MLLQGDYYLVFDITRMNDVQYSKFLKMVRSDTLGAIHIYRRHGLKSGKGGS